MIKEDEDSVDRNEIPLTLPVILRLDTAAMLRN